MAMATGLEPATFGVTGRLINKLKQCFLKLFLHPKDLSATSPNWNGVSFS